MNNYALEMKDRIINNLKDKDIIKELDKLESYIENGDLNSYKDFDFIGSLFLYLCNYPEYGMELDKSIVNRIYQFKKYYNYTGKIFRGIKGTTITYTEDLYSWSSDKDVAYRFISEEEGLLLEKEVVEEFSLCEMMISIMEYGPEYYYNELEIFFGEDECYSTLFNSTIDGEVVF